MRYITLCVHKTTHSGVTKCANGDETKRRVNAHSTATAVFGLALYGP
jgi:hypothetical protein